MPRDSFCQLLSCSARARPGAAKAAASARLLIPRIQFMGNLRRSALWTEGARAKFNAMGRWRCSAGEVEAVETLGRGAVLADQAPAHPFEFHAVHRATVLETNAGPSGD